jgi:hypothetical protein
MPSPEGLNPDEEVNALIAGMSPEERTETLSDREFQETLGCDIVPDIGFVTFSCDLSDEDKEEAFAYLRWLRERRNRDASQ